MGLVDTLSLNRRVNTLGVAGSLLLLYVVLSDKPWWILTGGSSGERAILIELSPFTFTMEVLGRPLTIPVVFYVNLAAKLSILLAIATTALGSILASKPWSNPMISVKGLILPILFIVGVFTLPQIAQLTVGLSGIPILGESNMRYAFKSGEAEVVVEIPLKSEITIHYWIALVAGIISIPAKILQGRIAKRSKR